MVTAELVKREALACGFDLCGVARAEVFPELAGLSDWIARGYAGEMTYLERSAETRADITRFLPTARSVIVTGTVYYTDPPAPTARGADDGSALMAKVARYAWGEDYHRVLDHRLEQLVARLRAAHDAPFDARIFLDKHHVQERVFAKYAGLGWIGKNTCLINPDAGSWVLLAGVATSLDLPPDAPVPDLCGDCTLCLDACPTGALVNAHELDATRCISYLTIEHQGPIPEAWRPSIGDHLFGCDICQDVCPYNLAPLRTADPVWQPQAGRDRPDAGELWRRRDQDLHDFVRGSAMEHLTTARLRRNLAVVQANQGRAIDPPGDGVPNAAHSAETPLVKEHVAWAQRQVGATTHSVGN